MRPPYTYSLRSSLGLPAVVAAHILGFVAVAIPLISGIVAFTVHGQLVAGAGMLIATTAASLMLVCALEGNSRAVGHWRLGPWYLVWIAFGFGVASFTWLTRQVGTPAVISELSVVRALQAMTVFVIIWTIGYAAGPPAIALKAVRKLSALTLGKGTRRLRPGVRASLILYGIGFCSRAISLVLQGRIGYLGDASAGVAGTSWYNQFLNIGATLAAAGLALASFNHFSGRVQKSRAILALLTAAEAGFAIISGNKEPFVAIGLAIIIPYGAARGRLPIKSLLFAVAAFLLIVLPFNAAYREAINENRDASAVELMASAPSLLASTVASGDLSIIDDSYETLLRRVRLIDGVAVTMQKTPTAIPYESPTEYASAPFIGLVPRLVWPDKPVLIAGYQVSHLYYGLPEYVFTSSTLSTPGTIYRHGGWPIFLVASLLLGVLYRLFDKFARPEVDPKALFLVLALFPGMVKSEIDSVEMLISLPTLLVGAIIAIRIATQRCSV